MIGREARITRKDGTIFNGTVDRLTENGLVIGRALDDGVEWRGIPWNDIRKIELED